MPANAPRILFISPCWPISGQSGGQLRALHTARALKHVGEVSLLVVGADAGDKQAALLAAAEFKIVAPAIPTLRPNLGLWQRLRWALDLRYLNVHGYVVAAADRARIAASLADYDLIWVLNCRTPNLLGIEHWPRAHLDLDDIPSSYLQRVAETHTGSAQRWKARTQQLLLHRRERHLRRRFTTLSVCSEADRSYLGSSRTHVIPNGFLRPTRDPTPLPMRDPPRLGFIGLYSYAPNHDGVRWFLQNAWPLVRRAVPGVRFRLLGKDTDGALRPRETDVDTLGWMEDPSEEISTWSAMTIPLRLGAGTRIKLADAFSRKCPVVSTRFGARGYAVSHEKQLLLADSAPDFARACVRLIENPEFGRHLAANGWNDFLQHWTWDSIAPKVWAAAEDCLRRSETRRGSIPSPRDNVS